MRYVFAVFLAILLASCSQVAPDDAQRLAHEILSGMQDGPSLTSNELLQALVVTRHDSGMYPVELRDEKRGLFWAVIVQPPGQPEISRMAIDG